MDEKEVGVAAVAVAVPASQARRALTILIAPLLVGQAARQNGHCTTDCLDLLLHPSKALLQLPAGLLILLRLLPLCNRRLQGRQRCTRSLQRRHNHLQECCDCVQVLLFS